MARVSKRNRRLLVGAAVVVVAIVGAVIGANQPALAPSPAASSSPSAPTASPSATAQAGSPAAQGEAPEPLLGEPVAAAVDADGTADFGDRVTAALSNITPFAAKATQLGEVDGPAVRVTIRISNGSGAAIQLDEVGVNAYYGADLTPATPLGTDDSSTPFGGSLAPGATADGSYSFSVPKDDADDLVVSVGKVPGQPLVVFGR